MGKGRAAFEYLPQTSIQLVQATDYSIESLKAGINKVAQFQEEGTVSGTFADEVCLMDNPFSSCKWDFILAQAANVFATGTITLATAVAANTVTVNGLLYTGVDGAKSDNTEFSVDTSDTAAALDLADSITNDTRTGTLGDVSAVSAVAVVTVTTDVVGTNGNAVTLAKVGTPITLSGATLAGGVSLVDFQLTFDSEVITNIITIGRPALASRRTIDVDLTANGFLASVRSVQAAINFIEKLEDRVAETGVGSTGDATYTDISLKGTNPYDVYVWTITKLADVYTLVPTATSN